MPSVPGSDVPQRAADGSWASSLNAQRTMRATRRADTEPEIALRSALHQRGLRFRKDYRIRTDARSMRVDIVFPAKRVAVFVDGCFWHRCPDHGSQPKTNHAFWEDKLSRNVARDRETDAALRAAGWHVIRCWEHEPVEGAATRIVNALQHTGRSGLQDRA